MYIELKNDRICGSEGLIKEINISVLDQTFFINILKKENLLINSEFIPPQLLPILPLPETVSVNYENIKHLSEDFGIISIAFNYTFSEYQVLPVSPKTFMGKTSVSDYHTAQSLVPMVLIFTPYRDCEFSECNVLIRKLTNIEVSTNIVFGKTVSCTSDFIYFDFPWGQQNYPKIISPSEAKIGEKINLEVTSPNNRPVLIETNLGRLNKYKITKTTNVELDLTDLQDTDEDVIIKIGYKYWSGIEEKGIKLL